MLEKKDMRGLKELAGQVSPEAVALVERKGGWDEAAKVTVVQSGSEVAAKWANKFGISAEYAPEVALTIAGVAIWSSRESLVDELRKLAAERREREKGADAPTQR